MFRSQQPTMIFFTGTSAVGKTQALDALLGPDYVRVPMTARAQREKLGNPSWDALINSQELAEAHQDAILSGFMAIVSECQWKLSDDRRHQVFERGLVDVIGYSHAFGCSEKFINSQWVKLLRFEKELQRMRWALTVFFRPWSNHPYAAEAARPPEVIRDNCGAWLNRNLHRSSIPVMRRGGKDVSHDEFKRRLANTNFMLRQLPDTE